MIYVKFGYVSLYNLISNLYCCDSLFCFGRYFCAYGQLSDFIFLRISQMLSLDQHAYLNQLTCWEKLILAIEVFGI